MFSDFYGAVIQEGCLIKGGEAFCKVFTYQLPLLNVQTQECHPLLPDSSLEPGYTSVYHLLSYVSLSG